MNSTKGRPTQSPRPQGLSRAARFGLWGCGGCAVVVSIAIIGGGWTLARFLRQHPDSLQQLYGPHATPVLIEQPGGVARTISTEYFFPVSVAWSPDSRRLALCAMPKIAPFKNPPLMPFFRPWDQKASMQSVLQAMGPRVVIIDLATGTGEVIYSPSGETVEMPDQVLWFPDAQRLAIVAAPMPINDSETENEPPRLWTLNADGSNLRKIAENAWLPVISPDGQWIAYRQQRPDAKEHPLMVVSSDGAVELTIWEQSVAQVMWDKTGRVLYFRPREGQWQRVRLPDGTPHPIRMRTVEGIKRTALSSEEWVGIRGLESGETEYYHLISENPSQGLSYHLSPPLETYARSLGNCLGGRYILVKVETPPHSYEYLLWVYRLADSKFYQITDDPELEEVFSGVGSSCIAPSGDQVCLQYELGAPDVWKMFTTGISMPLMVLHLDEERILAQPGRDEPLTVSSPNQGATQ